MQADSPGIQLLRRQPLPTQNFPVADPQTKAPIAASTLLILPDGRKFPAGTYYAELNKIEKGLNGLGYSLRTMPQELVLQKSVISSGQLRQQASQITSIGPRLEPTALRQRFLSAPVLSSGERVLMGGALSPQVAQSIHDQNVGKGVGFADHQLKIIPQTGITRPGFGTTRPHIGIPRKDITPQGSDTIKPIKPRGGITANGSPIIRDHRGLNSGVFGGIQFKSPKTFHREQPWNWSVGNSSSAFMAYVNGNLVADGKACPVSNPSDAEILKSASEYTLSGTAQAGGAILGQNITLLTAQAKFYAPSNSTKPLNASAQVQVLGYTVYNNNQDVPDNWSKSDSFSQSLHYSVPFSIPLGPVWLGGEIGTNGEAGLKYSISMNRTGVGGSLTPYIHSNVYGEGGANVVIAGAGVGVQMTLLNADLDLYGQARLGWFLKWIFFQDLYVGYQLKMLDGRVYGYVYVYVPDWGIPPWKKQQWEHDFWNWDGVTSNGTLVNYDNILTFDDWDTGATTMAQ